MHVHGTPATGENLRAQRRAAGFSQERVAHLAGCSSSMVRLLERGYEPATSEVLDRIAAVLAPETSEARVTTPSPTKTAKTVATRASG